MSPLTLPQTNGSRVVKPADEWLQLSVQEVFSAFNWDDHPPEVHASTLAVSQEAAEPVSLDMSVSRFFASFNWEGAAIAAPKPQTPLHPAPKKDFTLDEFSDLF